MEVSATAEVPSSPMVFLAPPLRAPTLLHSNHAQLLSLTSLALGFQLQLWLYLLLVSLQIHSNMDCHYQVLTTLYFQAFKTSIVSGLLHITKLVASLM